MRPFRVLALRSLWRAPGVTLTAAATLAIGIGANTAIFSAVHAILLRPLPFHEPDRLLRLYETEATPGQYPFAGPDFVDWRVRNRTFEDMAMFSWRQPMNLAGGGRPDVVQCVPTAANFFSVVGAAPLIGRTWVAGEDQPGKNRIAVLSHKLWSSRYAGDRGVLGKTIELDSVPHTIVGVMPAGFLYPAEPQLWIPMDMSPKALGQRGNHSYQALGRMKPGVTPAAALADLTAIASGLERDFPDSNHKVGAAVVPMREDLSGRSRNSLLLLLSAVGLVLLIACANVANLLLSRAVARQKEMAVRAALGAGSGRLLWQLLTESLVLAALGGILGVLLGAGLIEVIAQAKNAGLPHFAVIRLDGAVLAFAAGLTLVTGLVFGIYPAIHASRPNLADELKGGAGSSVSPSRGRRFTSRALVVSEFALSLLLLASAGLLLKDFLRLRNTDTGVRPEGVWTAMLQLPEARYPDDPKRLALAEALVAQARQIPGVNAAVVTNRLPVEGGGNYSIQLRGQAPHAQRGLLVEYRAVTPGYFAALGIPLLKGRDLTAADTGTVVAHAARYRELEKAAGDRKLPPNETNAMVFPTVINETMARTFWPNQNPVGQMFSQGNPNGPWRQVVGVAADTRQVGLANRPKPEAVDVFDGSSYFYLVLRTALPSTSLTGSVRRVLGRIDSTLPLFGVRTMDDVIDEDAGSKRFVSMLVSGFAALAALLAAIGIYGVLSYAVTQRTREIGVRIALGASRQRVLVEVIREGALLAGIGFALGIGGTLAVGRLLASLLHDVRPADPAVLGATAGVLALVALTACYLPARRAAALDPMRALRHD